MSTSVEARVNSLEKEVSKLNKTNKCLFSLATRDLFIRIWRNRDRSLNKIKFAWLQSSSFGDRLYIRKGPFLIKLQEDKGTLSPQLFVLDPPNCEVSQSGTSAYPSIEGKSIDVTDKQGIWHRCIDAICQGELRTEVIELEGKKTKLDRATSISLEYAVNRGFAKELLPNQL